MILLATKKNPTSGNNCPLRSSIKWENMIGQLLINKLENSNLYNFDI